ncbi:MAG: geranylgeranyl pyrophosphate synthase [Actinomycetota bacterium]
MNSMPKADAPAFVAGMGAAVEAELAALIAHERAVWTADHADLGVPFDEIEGLVLGGGKRLRPAFCLLGAVAAGGGQTPDVVRAGAALELLHAMALFHDDVIDASVTRRGRETTHVRHARLHRAEGWAGEASRFGDGVAIIIGDLAYVYADRFMESMSAPVRDVWTKMRLEVNIGQYLDVVGSARRDYTVEAAERIALFKTAKYTIERPLHIGALIAQPAASPSLLDALSGYGVALGVAFQMRDDILGIFGEPEVTGKPAGDDLRESKPTALVALALSRADAAQRKILEQVGDPELDSVAIADIRQVIVETSALVDVEKRISELVDESLRALDVLNVNGDVREMFVSLGEVVAWRNV